MTQAPFVMRAFGPAQITYDHRRMELSDEGSDQESLLVQQIIRAAIMSAVPMTSDHYKRHRRVLKAREIWNEGTPAAGTIVETYLRTMGLVSKKGVTSLVRFNPSVLHEPTNQSLPAMVVPVRNLDGAFVGVHKTYLKPDGSGKADVADIYTHRPLGKCYGSHVQLCRKNGVKLVLAESIEMAIGIEQSCPELVVWSATSLGNMKSPVPASVKELILCVDKNNRDTELAEKLLRDAAREHMDRGIAVKSSRLGIGDLLKIR